MKRSVAESVRDKASVYTWGATFQAVSAPEQYCSTPLLKVRRRDTIERSVSDRYFKRVPLYLK